MPSKAPSPIADAAAPPEAHPPPSPPKDPPESISRENIAAVCRRHEESSLETSRAIHRMKMQQIIRWLRSKAKTQRTSPAGDSSADADMDDRSPPPFDPSLAAGIAASASSFADVQTSTNATADESIPLLDDAPLKGHL